MLTGDIAITGLDLMLPGCGDVREVWRDLRDGRVSGGAFPAARSEQLGLPAGESPFMPGSYLQRIDEFDHKRFGLSQKSADYMDPNQRLALLSATRAMHDAGCLDSIRGSRSGVYGSVNTTQQYQYQQLLQEEGLTPELLGMLNSTISSRINFVYDLRGPSLMTDTACSSSLVSVIQASEDLRRRIVDRAVAVSVNVYVKPGLRKDKLVNILAADGKTRSFDERSTGTSIGEGVCSVILKRREDAERDGDRIYALIRNYSLNNDGQTMNMSSPNPEAQARLLREAWAPVGDGVGRLAFVEAHGTGTAIGDTIEFEALNAYFLARGLKAQTVALTAGKSNFGHLDVASGLFSLIKSALSLHYRTVLPHPDFRVPNEEIEFVPSPFYIPERCEALAPDALAGVSSFGMTGTNAHVVLEGWAGEPQAERPEGALPLRLARYWFPKEGNSFKVRHALQRMESERRLLVQFPLHSRKHWEIAEHKFGSEHLMVGTAVFEILAQGLGGTAYSLEKYDLAHLHLLRQLSVFSGGFTVTLELDKQALKGSVHYTLEETTLPWLQFELRERLPQEKLRQEEPERHALAEPATAGMRSLPVTSQVGETCEDIAVSRRWEVVDELWVSEELDRAVVRLRVPEGLEREFGQYAFYPAMLDPAFNALNRLAEPDEIVFPWLWNEVSVRQTALAGPVLQSEIRLRERTRDERGHVILSFDVDLFDGQGRLALSARGYQAKNAARDAAGAEPAELRGFFHREQLVPAFAEFREAPAPDTLHLAHESLRGTVEAEAPVRYFASVRELLELLPNLERQGAAELFLWDRNCSGEDDIAGRTYELGQVLLKLNGWPGLNRLTYVTNGLTGGTEGTGVSPGNRAVALGLHSLRLEVRYAVVLIDTDYTQTGRLERLEPSGESWLVQRGGEWYAVRLKRFQPAAPKTPLFADGDTVLVPGGGSGIGRAYLAYASSRYPGTQFIAAGRREEMPAWPQDEASHFGSGFGPAGPNVRYVRLDITDEAQVRAFADRAGGIAAVLNFAGEPAQGLFLNKTEGDFRKKAESKIAGSALLGRCFGEAKAIFHFSSLAGLIGAVGQAEYCMANAYQSGLALAEGSVRTLNLTGWSDTGMSAGQADPFFEKVDRERGAALLDRFIQSGERYASMFRLTGPAAEAYTSLLAPAPRPKAEAGAAAIAGSSGAAAGAADLSGHDGVLHAWKLTLGEDEYDPSVSFFEQGGDSITIVQLCDELNRIYPGVFDVTTLFSVSTIEGQAALAGGCPGDRAAVQAAEETAGEPRFDPADILAFLNA
ncbi:KR domain-containing protein [Paenibacillus spiritus]|uniref:KR domain-containing protein n=1 Tax=Paenibacillus spiritus TaxID=2496557 RepID=A0A5J5FXF5_9BACL|nr:beta-ketoacyl synthase N-terminal-like domain-containing protein [Paenibacillus spiritus]KAA8998814.1 KR domain-containing protein [Paenibacillus spiritus]